MRQSVIDTVEWHARQPFVWGVSDCGILFADAIVEAGGPDVLADIRGYRTSTGAGLALIEAGFASVRALVEARLAEIPVARAQPGDVAFQRMRTVCAFCSPAVVVGDVAISKDFRGRVVVSRGSLVRAYTWRS